ncbi:MAG: hypothetical protein U9R60_10365, partial [Bacteroidota bacterium]|nr:hypothetical protein [Bacteroidota bacterium]
MVNRKKSQFGKGWSINGIKRLVVDGNRVVMVNGDGSYQEYEQGIDYADLDHGANIISSSADILNKESMLMQKVSFKVNRKIAARFDYGNNARPPTGTNQEFVVDLGDEKTIYTIGIKFPGFWKINNVWDHIKISTSVDNTNWTLWYSYGEPTLQNPEDITDPLDFHIQSPLIISGSDRSVRYIKFELGYPAINSIHVGSGIEKVYAIGSESLYRNIDGLKWPKLEYDSNSSQFTLTEFSGDLIVFNNEGQMLEKRDRQGRTITYQYNGDKVSRIQYPEGVYMDFIYNAGGFISKVKDSTGRETNISTDSNGNVTEVIYPDNTKREFDYNDRGLMTMDKNGDAIKTYTWNANWPVLEKIILPNSGERIIDSWMNDFLLNDIESSETNLVNFPYDSSTLKQESTITLEDGGIRKYVSEVEYSEQYLNGQLQERVYYGITNKNTLPYKIEKGVDQYKTTNIYYDDNLQLKKVETTLNDVKWGKVDSDPNAHYEKKSDILTAKTYKLEVGYNENNLVSNVKAYGINNTFTYDTNKNLTQSYDEIRLKTTTYTYDANNNLVRIDSPDNIKNEMTYNDKGLIMEVINNDDTKTVVTRNSRGEITSITDEENRTVSIDRDIMGRAIKETSPSGRIVQYEWGGTGCTDCGSALKLTKIIDSGTKTWEFTYDIMGNPTEMIYPDGTKIMQTYDIASRLITYNNKRGQVIEYEYDADGKLTEKTTPEGVIYFTYDARNRITGIEAADYHYQYDYGLADTFILPHLPIVKETNLLNNKWSEYISTYEGLPFEYFDSFYWRKVYEYRFDSSAGTPPGPTPTKVQYFRKYAAGNYTTWYEYDNGYRVLKKTQSHLGRDMTFSYKNRLLLRKRYYEYQYSGFPFIEMNFDRDNSGLITSITGDKALTAVYNNDLEIEQVQHTVP